MTRLYLVKTEGGDLIGYDAKDAAYLASFRAGECIECIVKPPKVKKQKKPKVKRGPYWRIDKATYNSWRGMRDRAGRRAGYEHVTVAPRWNSFEAFVEDMGIAPENHWLDRIDPSGGYAKDNCRWIPREHSNANRVFTPGPCGYRGVWRRPSGRYVAHMRVKDRNVCLGTFDDPRDAAAAYDAATTARFGDVAMTNRRLGLLP